MRIEFKFNSKSSGQNVPEAIRLADKCGGVIKNNYYKINFESPGDKNLRKLFELVGNLKGSVISINGEEPVVAHKFFYAINCPEKLLCKGLCKHVRLGYYDIQSFLENNSEYIENGVFSISDENLIKSMTNFLEVSEEDQFIIDKKRFLEHFQIETEMEKEFCEKYNILSVEKELEKFPNKIKLVPYEEVDYADEDGLERRESSIEKLIETVLSYSILSSELSNKEMMQCAKAMTLLNSYTSGVSIEDTDIIIFAFPRLSKFILTKLILISDYPEESDDEELIYVVKIEEGFFCASNPHSKLYFKLFDDDDSKIEEYFKILKRIK